MERREDCAGEYRAVTVHLNPRRLLSQSRACDAPTHWFVAEARPRLYFEYIEIGEYFPLPAIHTWRDGKLHTHRINNYVDCHKVNSQWFMATFHMPRTGSPSPSSNRSRARAPCDNRYHLNSPLNVSWPHLSLYATAIINTTEMSNFITLYSNNGSFINRQLLHQYDFLLYKIINDIIMFKISTWHFRHLPLLSKTLFNYFKIFDFNILTCYKFIQLIYLNCYMLVMC